jgi:HEAT repeat protein
VPSRLHRDFAVVGRRTSIAHDGGNSLLRVLLWAATLLFLAALTPVHGQQLDEDARRDRIMQWQARATPADCEALTGALTDESFDLRSRAASALYWKCDRTAAATFAPLLCRTLELGNAEAGAALLLGYARAEAAVPCLQKAAQQRRMVKLAVSARPVPIALPVRVALARLRQAEGVRDLRTAFEKPDLETSLFLLGVLRDIEDREALRASLRFLDDEREAPGVVSHAVRTVRDVAVEALAERFSLKPTFAIEPGRRYTPAQAAEIRGAAEQKISSL